MKHPTNNQIAKLFTYYRIEGVLRWKEPAYFRRTDLIGEIAGGKDGRGYLSVRINKKAYKIHRLIWFIEYGTWPKMIDHIDGDPSNNFILNLRASDDTKNQHNRKSHRKGKLVGAHWNKRNQVWTSSIRINKKPVFLGRFDSEIKAHKAYMKAHEQELLKKPEVKSE